MRFAFMKAYFTPDRDVVTLAVIALDGSLKGTVKDLYTGQRKLIERNRAALSELEPLLPEHLRTKVLDTWGDDESKAEARQLLEAAGDALVEACVHYVAIGERCLHCTPLTPEELIVDAEVTG